MGMLPIARFNLPLTLVKNRSLVRTPDFGGRKRESDWARVSLGSPPLHEIATRRSTRVYQWRAFPSLRRASSQCSGVQDEVHSAALRGNDVGRRRGAGPG